jgi:ribose transport system substrate-binding protein
VTLLAFPWSGEHAAGAPTHSGKFKIVLSNNYMGNEWRPQMENVAKFISRSSTYKGLVDLEIDNSGPTPTDQIQSLQSIIRRRPSAILIDAASATALNPTVQLACNEHILVFSFDQVVTAPCAYKLPEDYAAQAHDMVNWLGTVMHGHGDILMDRGLPGIPISEVFVSTWTKTLKTKYPHITVVGKFSSEYAPGPELQSVSSLLAQHRHINGILSGGYCSSDLKALQQAGDPAVPMTCLDVNGNEIDCMKAKIPCFFFGAPAWVSGVAIEHAVNILMNKASYPKSQPYYDVNFVTKYGDISFNHVQKVAPLKVGVNYYPGESPSLITPVSYDHWNITPADVLGS